MAHSVSSHPPVQPHRTDDDSLVALGAPALLHGESRSAFDRVLADVRAAVGPTEIIEEFFVADVVTVVWEASRWRRLRDSLLSSSMANGLRDVLAPLTRSFASHGLVDRWYAREEAAVAEVDKLLAKAGLTMEDVMAQTLSKKLPDIERIDRMIASLEARRHATLRELDRHRSASAARLRRATEKIEDADFAEVDVERDDGHGDKPASR